MRLSTGTRRIAPRVHIALKRLALCLDCDECFEIGYSACPACGSSTWTALNRFLEFAAGKRVSGAVAATMAKNGVAATLKGDQPRHLLIVARHRLMLFEHLKKAFADHDSVKVVLDRRTSDRRTRQKPGAPERRQTDRREAHARIEDQIKSIGWSLVLLDLKKPQT